MTPITNTQYVSSAFLLAGYAETFITGVNLADVVAREILGLCDPLTLKTGESYYPCASAWERIPLDVSLSLAFLITGLAIPYSSTVLDKIKSLPLFGKVKNSSEIEPKDREIDLFVSATHLAAIIPIMSAAVAGGYFTCSLSKFSELALRQLSGTCINEIMLNSTEIAKYDHCIGLINDGNVKLLAAGLALTALGASVASMALIGRVRKWANSTPNN